MRMTEQIELGQNHHNPTNPKPAGYTQWASWIASDSDSEPFLFRKFDELAALNLLYLQSEMLSIEAQLRQLDQEDVRQPDIDSINATRQWEILVAQCAPPEFSDSESANTESKACIRARRRMELILRLRTKIKEYHEALLLQSKVAHLQAPSGRVLRAVKQMFNQGGFPVLDGQAREYLDANDLLALKSPTTDPLSNFLRRARASKVSLSRHTHLRLSIPTIEARPLKNDIDSEKTKIELSAEGLPRIGRFDEHQVVHWVNIITIIVAIIFLIGPILALYFVQNPPARLVLITIFTAGFAASVALITNARRAEVFFGTATYAAVLVVFVSNGDLSGG
ncbi:hypothetical protein F5Y01DRAFT_139981 [Xylaria sp. FL0043]|nr:hypothetical protein F5Y01DRAFT_139981 [Xylaria sp. FL0043]